MFKVLSIFYLFWRMLNVLRLFILYPWNCWISNNICWKHMGFIQSKISLFNKRTLLKFYDILYTTLLNIDYTSLNIWPNVGRFTLITLQHMKDIKNHILSSRYEYLLRYKNTCSNKVISHVFFYFWLWNVRIFWKCICICSIKNQQTKCK